MPIWLEWSSGFNKGSRHNLSDSPCPAIMAGGIGGSGQGQYHLVIESDDMKKKKQTPDIKPAYVIPSMAEVHASPTHGLKVASTFAGGGGSCTGYAMAGFDVVWANEFIPAAQDTYRINHPMTILDGRDIKKVTPEEILAQLGLKAGELDLLDGSPPCFPGNTLITTSSGRKMIADLKVGESVLTHRGRFKPIVEMMQRNYGKRILRLKIKYGRNPVDATPEHPFYVKRRKSGRSKSYSPAQFVRADDLKPGDLVLEPFANGCEKITLPPVVMKERGQTFGQSGRDGFEMKLSERPCVININSAKMAWLLGFYAAEGHRRGRNPSLDRNGPCRRVVIYSVADNEVPMLVEKLMACGFKTCVTKSRGGASRVTVTSIDFWIACSLIGDGAANKQIPERFHSMPLHWQEEFLDAYYTGDGCIQKSKRIDSVARKATTVSRTLADGIVRMTARVFKVVAQCKQTHWAGASKIEGRTVQIKDTYSVGFTLPRNNGRVRPGCVTNEGAWLPIIAVESVPGPERVFNIEVADDNSYVAGGFAVHNCQSFSSAGLREKGWGKGKKYENGVTQNNEELFNEYVRLLRGLMPKVFVAENVKGLTFGTAKKKMGEAQLDAFDKQDETILHMLMDSGYKVEWRVLDAKHYGVPQTRNRVIFIGIRNDIAAEFSIAPAWPKKLPHVYTIRDACPWIGRALHDTQSEMFQRGAGEVTDKPAPAVTDGKRGAQLQVEVCTGNDGFKPTFGPPDVPSPTITAMPPRIDHATNGVVRIVQQQGSNQELTTENPCPAVCATQVHDQPVQEERRKFTIQEVKRICAFPDDYVLTGTYSKQWERLGNSVPPLFMKAIAETIRDEIFAKMEPLKWRKRSVVTPPALPTPQPESVSNKRTKEQEEDYWRDYWAKRFT